MEKLLSNNRSTFGELLQWGETALEASSSSPRLDSEILLGHVLGLTRTGVLARLRDECSEEARNAFELLIGRRANSEPVAYIVGEREFFGLRFEVNPSVLIPRPETELVVEQAVRFLATRKTVRLLDLGTGSGCIAISIVHELLARGGVEVACDAVDQSIKALEVAKANAEELGVGQFLRFVTSNWCSNLSELSPPYDCIVANPPYIDPHDELARDLSFEPQSALYSDHGGLGDATRLLQEAVPLLKPDGLLLCEIGAGKRGVVESLVAPYKGLCEVSYLGDSSPTDSYCVIQLRRVC